MVDETMINCFLIVLFFNAIGNLHVSNNILLYLLAFVLFVIVLAAPFAIVL